MHVCVSVRVPLSGGGEKNKNYPSLCCSLHFHFTVGKKNKKDTASKLQSESQWLRFSAQGQKPLRMVDMEIHDAQSAGKSRIYIRPPVS